MSNKFAKKESYKSTAEIAGAKVAANKDKYKKLEAVENKKTATTKKAEAKAAPKTKAAKKESAPRKEDTRKIKVLNKNHGAREGSKRAAWMDALTSSKTVAQAREKVEGLDAGVLSFAEKAGIVELTA